MLNTCYYEELVHTSIALNQFSKNKEEIVEFDYAPLKGN